MQVAERGRRTALSLGEDSGWVEMGAAEARDARAAMARAVTRMVAFAEGKEGDRSGDGAVEVVGGGKKRWPSQISLSPASSYR